MLGKEFDKIKAEEKKELDGYKQQKLKNIFNVEVKCKQL